MLNQYMVPGNVAKELNNVMYPLYNSMIRDMFLSLCQIVVLGNFKHFFSMYHQIDITLYDLHETTALCYSEKRVLFWTPS